MSAERDAEAEDAILALLQERDRGKTICPSDAARVIAGPEDFRPQMDRVRAAAGDLVARNEIEVTQKGRVIDLASARGPIRLRLPREDH